MDDLRQKIEILKTDALAEIRPAADLRQMEDLRVKYFGRKSEVQNMMKDMKNVSPEIRQNPVKIPINRGILIRYLLFLKFY